MIEPILCLTSVALLTYGIRGLIVEKRDARRQQRAALALIPAQRRPRQAVPR